MQKGKKEVTTKLVEYPLKQDLLASQDMAMKIQVQVKDIT